MQKEVINLLIHRVYTVRDVAELLQISTKTVYQVIKEKELDVFWVRGQIRITDTALQTYLQGEFKNEK